MEKQRAGSNKGFMHHTFGDLPVQSLSKLGIDCSKSTKHDEDVLDRISFGTKN